MTREQLRVWLSDNLGCMCGQPEEAMFALYNLLEWFSKRHRGWDVEEKELNEMIAGTGLQMLMFYWLEKLNLTEHGTSVPGWLTELGREIYSAMKVEAQNDGFDTLVNVFAPIHDFPFGFSEHE